MRAKTIILILIASGLFRGFAAAEPEYPPRVAIPQDVYKHWVDSHKQSFGTPEDDAEIQQCVLATYPKMKLKQYHERLLASWVTPNQVIVPTFTGGIGGGTRYLCVVNRQGGRWQLDHAYYNGSFD